MFHHFFDYSCSNWLFFGVKGMEKTNDSKEENIENVRDIKIVVTFLFNMVKPYMYVCNREVILSAITQTKIS
jgi:hypothetical protein